MTTHTAESIPVAAVMDALPELVDQLRARLDATRTAELDLAYDWLLQADAVVVRPDGALLMPSDGGPGAYVVRGRRCTCPDHHRRGGDCKHIRRAWMFLRAAQIADLPVAHVAYT